MYRSGISHRLVGAAARNGEVGDELAAATLGADPFLGLTPAQTARALGRLVGRLAQRPAPLVGSLAALARDEFEVLSGQSSIQPEQGDRRFRADEWCRPHHRRMMQSYLALSRNLYGMVDAAGLDPKSALRARFAVSLLVEAIAPSNGIVTNPVVLDRAVETRGRSLVQGARNFAQDLTQNAGMPSIADGSAFRIGENVARTPGAVIWRNEVAELIQYGPASARVFDVPVLLITSQVNKYFVLDLAEGRSLIEYAVSRGLRFFALSWRNPTPEHRDWDLDTYVACALEAAGVVRTVTRSPSCHVVSLCAGGLTGLGVLTALRERCPEAVASASFLVSVLDTSAAGMLGALASSRSAKAALRRARRRGLVSSAQLSRAFAWLRPNDLVWTLSTQRWLLGDDAPASAVLYWTEQATNLPAALYAQFIDLLLHNPLATGGQIRALGMRIEPATIDVDVYFVAAADDHISPWRAAFASAQLFGRQPRFVCSSGGHIQCLVTPPNASASYYLTNDEAHPFAPGAWLDGATKHDGSWWEDWVDWLIPRSGQLRRRSARLGSSRHPVLCAAPGEYIHE